VLLCGDWGGHVGAQPRGGDPQRRPGHQTQETGRGPGRLLHASPVDRPADRPQPAFAEFYQQPGHRTPAGRDRLVRAGGPILDRVNRALGYLEELLPDSIDEACFIDRSGPEVARVVRGERATRDELSPDESASPLLQADLCAARRAGLPGQALRLPRHNGVGHFQLYPAADARPQQAGDRALRDHHRELPAQAALDRQFDIAIVDAATGAVVIDSRLPQQLGAKLGRIQRDSSNLPAILKRRVLSSSKRPRSNSPGWSCRCGARVSQYL
jgi:hypothetical protein